MTSEEFHDAMRSMTDPDRIATTVIGRSVRQPPRRKPPPEPEPPKWDRLVVSNSTHSAPAIRTTRAIKTEIAFRTQTPLEKRINRIIGIVGRTIGYLFMAWVATGVGFSIYLIVKDAH